MLVRRRQALRFRVRSWLTFTRICVTFLLRQLGVRSQSACNGTIGHLESSTAWGADT